MRFIEIDGERIEVHGCSDCPCYNEKDDDYRPVNSCKHPLRSKVSECTLCGGGTTSAAGHSSGVSWNVHLGRWTDEMGV